MRFMKRGRQDGSSNLLCPSEDLTKVAVVDDDENARWYLQLILEQSREFRCVGCYASGEEAIIEIPRTNPRVVLMDIRLPGMSGIESIVE